MNYKLIEIIRKLSETDKKNLSQTALKTSEECGELAKAVLPYDSAFATNHRFIEKKKILEETVDVTLCALSIAFKLGYTIEDIEEMIKEKSLVWADLQNREQDFDKNIPYEIHITVKSAVKEDFIKACKMIDVKPIILDLQNQDGKSVFEDVMTSSIFMGSNRGAYEEMKRISNALKEEGFNVVREKVETVPWHPAAPSEKHHNPVMPPNCYFETHFNVILDNDRRADLQAIAKDVNSHLSKNVFKKLKDDKETVMMTYRTYDSFKESFEEHAQKIEDQLKDNNFIVEKRITEFSIFDTKISHDSSWIKK